MIFDTAFEEPTDYTHCTGVPFRGDLQYCFRPVDIQAVREAGIAVSMVIVAMFMLVVIFRGGSSNE